MHLAHRKLLERIAHLRGAGDEEFIRCYPSLVAAVEHDFREQEILMDALEPGPFRVRLEQHARMLAALHCTMGSACGGDTEPARAALDLLGEWLAFELAALDRDLAEAMRGKAGAQGTTRPARPK